MRIGRKQQAIMEWLAEKRPDTVTPKDVEHLFSDASDSYAAAKMALKRLAYATTQVGRPVLVQTDATGPGPATFIVNRDNLEGWQR